jgi:hypothetical protein
VAAEDFSSEIVVLLSAPVPKRSCIGSSNHGPHAASNIRDDFRVHNCYNLCHGHPFAAMMLLDINHRYRHMTDPSIESFLVTLKNIHNVPAQTFALNGEWKSDVILCDSTLRPDFCDMDVSAICQIKGHSSTNNTGLDKHPLSKGFKRRKDKNE